MTVRQIELEKFLMDLQVETIGFQQSQGQQQE